MRTFDTGAEDLLVDVVHDLRQPLSNIEASTFVLNSLLRGAPPQAQQQLRLIERQVALASDILHGVTADIDRARAQRTEAGSLELTNSHTAAVT